MEDSLAMAYYKLSYGNGTPSCICMLCEGKAGRVFKREIDDVHAATDMDMDASHQLRGCFNWWRVNGERGMVDLNVPALIC